MKPELTEHDLLVVLLTLHNAIQRRGDTFFQEYGLTDAQSRVVALVIRGNSTRQIVQELHISANTVQEHLTAAFDKFGVRSRRELVAAMLTQGH